MDSAIFEPARLRFGGGGSVACALATMERAAISE